MELRDEFHGAATKGTSIGIPPARVSSLRVPPPRIPLGPELLSIGIGEVTDLSWPNASCPNRQPVAAMSSNGGQSFASVTMASSQCHRVRSLTCVVIDTLAGSAVRQECENTETRWPTRMGVHDTEDELASGQVRCQPAALLPPRYGIGCCSPTDVALDVRSPSPPVFQQLRERSRDLCSEKLLRGHDSRLSGAVRFGAAPYCVCMVIMQASDTPVHYAARHPQQSSMFVVITLFGTSLMLGVTGVTTSENADYWSLSPTLPNRSVTSVTTAFSRALKERSSDASATHG